MMDGCIGLRQLRCPGTGDEEIEREALDILNSAQVLPRLVVFDLDQTLWPFYCHNGLRRECIRLFPQARGILNALKEKGIIMALASRNSTPDAANALLQKLGLIPLFVDMVSKMGTTCILVYDGLNIEALKNGLRSFVNYVKRDGSIQVHCTV